jgi:hypothetical protein
MIGMIREPKDCGPDAWKRWLKQGFSLFDRTLSGWVVVWWCFSLAVIYGVEKFGKLFGILLLSGLSATAFGVHVAIYDVLAAGKRGPKAWILAFRNDIAINYRSYLRSGVVRVVVVSATLGAILLFSAGLALLLPDPPETPPTEVRPFWSLWSVWAWMWLIPAGWQRVGALGWGHWLVRREGVPVEVADKLARLGVAMNIRSYSFICATLMLPVMVLMFVFPPLIPLWDLYAAAVCWCIWDDVFGGNEGLKEMEKAKQAVRAGALSGA